MYLENAWYVAAWADEIGRALFSRTICDLSILMYRREDDRPIALGNVCPHRFAPLSMGLLRGDDVQCRYHGMVFGESGKCVHNPHHGGGTPSSMQIRSFPVVERYSLIWLWMGEPEKADPEVIPDYSCLVDPSFKTVKGVIEMNANYELVTDNLLDLTHVELVHEGMFSSPAVFASKLVTEQKNDTIWSNRWVPDAKAPPIWAKFLADYRGVSADANADHWLYMRWDAPAHMLLDVGATPAGGTRDDGVWIYGTDIITPASNTTSHYFWGVSRDHDLDDAELDAAWIEGIKIAFNGQDKPIIEAQQQVLGDAALYDMHPALIKADEAAVRAHRHLEKLAKTNTVPVPGGSKLKELQQNAKGSASPLMPVN